LNKIAATPKKYIVQVISSIVSMSEALELVEFCFQNELAHVVDGFDNFLQDDHIEFHEC